MTTPADELKTAAATLRQMRFPAAMTATSNTAALIGARLPLADWLEFHAAMDERLLALVDGAPEMDEVTWGGKPHPALAVARAVNAATHTTT